VSRRLSSLFDNELSVVHDALPDCRTLFDYVRRCTGMIARHFSVVHESSFFFLRDVRVLIEYGKELSVEKGS
jgi:hypothetical protein